MVFKAIPAFFLVCAVGSLGGIPVALSDERFSSRPEILNLRPEPCPAQEAVLKIAPSGPKQIRNNPFFMGSSSALVVKTLACWNGIGFTDYQALEEAFLVSAAEILESFRENEIYILSEIDYFFDFLRAFAGLEGDSSRIHLLPFSKRLLMDPGYRGYLEQEGITERVLSRGRRVLIVEFGGLESGKELVDFLFRKSKPVRLKRSPQVHHLSALQSGRPSAEESPLAAKYEFQFSLVSLFHQSQGGMISRAFGGILRENLKKNEIPLLSENLYRLISPSEPEKLLLEGGRWDVLRFSNFPSPELREHHAENRLARMRSVLYSANQRQKAFWEHRQIFRELREKNEKGDSSDVKALVFDFWQNRLEMQISILADLNEFSTQTRKKELEAAFFHSIFDKKDWASDRNEGPGFFFGNGKRVPGVSLEAKVGKSKKGKALSRASVSSRIKFILSLPSKDGPKLLLQ